MHWAHHKLMAGCQRAAALTELGRCLDEPSRPRLLEPSRVPSRDFRSPKMLPNSFLFMLACVPWPRRVRHVGMVGGKVFCLGTHDNAHGVYSECVCSWELVKVWTHTHVTQLRREVGPQAELRGQFAALLVTIAFPQQDRNAHVKGICTELLPRPELGGPSEPIWCMQPRRVSKEHALSQGLTCVVGADWRSKEGWAGAAGTGLVALPEQDLQPAHHPQEPTQSR